MRGREKKKGASGNAAQYITRKHALSKLQVTLKDFRKLCILKGIYPRDPPQKVKGKNKTYYHVKDIRFLSHDPILDTIRQQKIHAKRVRKAKARHEKTHLKSLAKTRPRYRLDHVIKERYPTFVDSLRDLDDCLAMVHLFAMLPRGDRKIGLGLLKRSTTLVHEFQNYVMRAHCLTKVFFSIKGIYYQASIHGQTVTWLAPYPYAHSIPKDIDYRVMKTFLEFYTVLLGFVNHRLYTDLGLVYPPELNLEKRFDGVGLAALELRPVSATQGDDEAVTGGPAQAQAQPNAAAMTAASAAAAPIPKDRIRSLEQRMAHIEEAGGEGDEGGEGGDASATTSATLETTASTAAATGTDVDDDQAEFARLDGTEGGSLVTAVPQGVFQGLTVFLNREVLRDPLIFMLQAHGATVSWQGARAPFGEDDERITHHVVDRPTLRQQLPGRDYVQPQWVADSINVGILLPCHEYAVGATLPPHLSPFVDDDREGYVPQRRKQLLRLLAKANGEVVEDDTAKQYGLDESGEELSSEEAHERVQEMEQKYQNALDAEFEQQEDSDGDSEDDDSEGVDNNSSSSHMSEEDSDDGSGLTAKQRARVRRRRQKEEEQKEMAAMLLPRKKQRLYRRIQYSNRAKQSKVDTLVAKKNAAAKAKRGGAAPPSKQTITPTPGGRKAKKQAPGAGAKKRGRSAKGTASKNAGKKKR